MKEKEWELYQISLVENPPDPNCKIQMCTTVKESYQRQGVQCGEISDGIGMKEFKKRKCRVCGCTDEKACIDEYGQSCHWVEDDLCSRCA